MVQYCHVNNKPLLGLIRILVVDLRVQCLGIALNSEPGKH